MSISIELLSSLLAAAAQFSGLPTIDVSNLPPIDVISDATFVNTVCPGKPNRCAATVAAFNTERYRIVIRDSLNLDSPAENSFLVHELVHVLQYKKDGSTRFMTCEGVLESEREAFDAQNRYIRANGLALQEGIAVRYMHCPPEAVKVNTDGTPN
jgi:hypothetical protein